MADNPKPKSGWVEVREALEANDVDKIAALKQRYVAECERNARKHYLKRLAVQSILAATYGDVLLKLKANQNDVLALFQHQVLMDYVMKHGLTIYKEPDQILPGDSVVITWTYKEKSKTKTSSKTLRILKKQKDGWLVSLAMWEHDETQFKFHETVEQITPKNFVIGVRQAVPPIMKKPQKFYFINVLD